MLEDEGTEESETYSHWVRMTSLPSFSTVVPGNDSYRESPIAWMGMLRAVAGSLRYVRITRAGKKPL